MTGGTKVIKDIEVETQMLKLRFGRYAEARAFIGCASNNHLCVVLDNGVQMRIDNPVLKETILNAIRAHTMLEGTNLTDVKTRLESVVTLLEAAGGNT